MIVLILLRELQQGKGRWSKFALWTVANAFAVGYHPGQNTWLQLNCPSAEKRAISVSLWVMSAMVGLMCGSEIFQGFDAKNYYPVGLLAMIIMVAAGLGVDLIQGTIYLWHNANRHRRNDDSSIHHVL